MKKKRVLLSPFWDTFNFRDSFIKVDSLVCMMEKHHYFLLQGQGRKEPPSINCEYSSSLKFQDGGRKWDVEQWKGDDN